MSNYEKNLALRQGHGIASEDGYFEARPQIDSMDRRKVFGAGFERGWEAALAAEPAQERIQALELEVRQLTEQIAELRHAPTPQADSQPALVNDEGEALDLLAVLFDAWENGTPCYEEPESSDGFLGNAFRIDGKVFHRCVNILNRRRSNQGAARAPADSVLEDAVRYLFLRDGKWRDTDLEPVIRLQLNSLWDAKIDAARKQGANHD